MMRRQDKAMQRDEAVQLLREGEYGILSTADADGHPYGVPLNYVCMQDVIYFHCALEGHKLDNILGNDRVSFCVVGRTRLLPGEFSTEFESVIAAGRAEIVDGEERYRALMGLVEKYAPDFVDDGPAYIAKFDCQTKVVKIFVDRLSGKARGPKARS